VTASIPVGHGPAAVAVNAAGAWVATAEDNKLARIDTGTNAVAGTTRVGDGPTAVLATASALWVANAGEGTVMRLDPSSGKVRGTIRLGGTPDALAAAAGRVWVAIAPAPPRPAAAGGVARVTMRDDFTTLDPARWVLPFLPYATCANLVTYPDKPAPAGSRIVPEVAETIPVPTDGGRTYTFKIRRGFRFSPPSNEPVTAATFKATIERVANPRTKSQYGYLLSGIVGYRSYVTGRARGLAGVVARGHTLTIRLSKPDGGFLATLAAGAACAAPRDTPADLGANDYVPAAGPYYISSYTPRQQLVLRRNPNYHGNRPHHFDQIVFAIGVGGTRALDELESGKADYAIDLPISAQPRLESQYGPGSKAARAGHQQYFISAANGLFFLHMNASRPLFSHRRLRRAVNYAIDRPALVAQGHRFSDLGPFNTGVASDDYLPPSIDGAEDFHVYSVNGPDLARAKRIAGRLQATAIMYTPNIPPWLQQAQIVKRDLKPLGIDVEVKEFSVFDYFRRIGLPNEPFDLALAGWWLLDTDPNQALNIFDSSTPFDTGSGVSHFNDPAFNRSLSEATKLSGTKRDRAYSRIALKLERDEAPAAAVATAASRDFFSARIGCQIYQPVFGMDIAGLCLRG
jgi:peptide/nickel transport system substrate-binding protein